MAETENLSIPMSTAITWTTAWRAKKTDSKWIQDHFVKAFQIKNAVFNNLIEQGAVSIRVYLGVDETETDPERKMKLVIVGVDSNGKDMTNEEEGDKAYNFTNPCPPLCDRDSPLN